MTVFSSVRNGLRGGIDVLLPVIPLPPVCGIRSLSTTPQQPPSPPNLASQLNLVQSLPHLRRGRRRPGPSSRAARTGGCATCLTAACRSSLSAPGPGIGMWLCLLIRAVVSPVGLLRHIAVAESEMMRVLGESRRGYQARTHRLVPGLW